LEADDLIACVVKQMPGVTLISNDSDLYQLLGFCEMYSIRDKSRYYAKDFIQQYQISPDEWVDVLSISGTHNNVKGIEGAGIAKALQYLKGRLPEGKIKERIDSLEGKRIIERNKELIRLPLENIYLDIQFPDVFNFDNWIKIFQQYDFRSFMSEKGMKNIKEDFFDDIRPRP
jgi:5'-3' exonuclease